MFGKRKIIATHNGGFHADDVFAVATLKLAMPKEKFEVIRTRDIKIIERADFVVDVGRIYDISKNRFDHHQEGGAGKRENDIPYASFGLVWKSFGEKICGKEEAKIIDRSLVSFIDAGDNGMDLFVNKTSVSNYSIASVIGTFNATSQEDEEKNDEVFLEMVKLAEKIILREIASAKEFEYGKKKIIDALKNTTDRRVIILEERIDKKIINDVLENEKDVLYVIHPYHKIGWALRALRKYPNSFESRLPLPASWAGKENEDMQKVTGVPDAIFCHNNLFVANAKTKEGALALAKIALEV